MKKLFLALVLGLLLCPLEMDAKLYKVKHDSENQGFPTKTPTLDMVDVSINESTGLLSFWSNYSLIGLEMIIEKNGVVYEQTTFSLTAGLPYSVSLADYEEGSYSLTLKNGTGDVIGQYLITIEDD